MNSKERGSSTIELEKADNGPMDFAANEGTLNKIHKHLKINSYKEVLKTFHVNILIYGELLTRNTRVLCRKKGQ